MGPNDLLKEQDSERYILASVVTFLCGGEVYLLHCSTRIADRILITDISLSCFLRK